MIIIVLYIIHFPIQCMLEVFRDKILQALIKNKQGNNQIIVFPLFA